MLTSRSHQSLSRLAALGALLLVGAFLAAPSAGATPIYLCQKKKGGAVRVVK